MMKEMKQKANVTFTENGAVTLRTTGSDCLDLFAAIGALRSAGEQDIITRFFRAFAEDRDLAMKILFYGRDIRGGLGERLVFRTILRQLAFSCPQSVKKNLVYISEYGRWDDLMVLQDTPCWGATVRLIDAQMKQDLTSLEKGENVSLMAKWLPSVNTSNAETVRVGKKLAKALGMSEAEYRKVLVKLRAEIRILENYLREKDYTFDYEKQPSKALFKYRMAFLNRDKERYERFMEDVHNGEAVLHTGTLMPYDIVEKAMQWHVSPEERMVLDATWKALESFVPQGNAMCVIDGSGSMYSLGTPTPAAVALSLGIYFAQHCQGEFHNHFITFSRHPQLVEIKGDDLVEQVAYCRSFNEVANTNVQAVFDLILDTAVENRIPQEQMPETLFLISDMEFDRCAEDASLSNLEAAKKNFEKRGYRLPKVVFWNVQSRQTQQPVSLHESGAILVSGFSPRIFAMVTSGSTDPYAFMLDTVAAERYAPICA